MSKSVNLEQTLIDDNSITMQPIQIEEEPNEFKFVVDNNSVTMQSIQFKEEPNVSNEPGNNIYIYEDLKYKPEINQEMNIKQEINEEMTFKPAVNTPHYIRFTDEPEREQLNKLEFCSIFIKEEDFDGNVTSDFCNDQRMINTLDTNEAVDEKMMNKNKKRKSGIKKTDLRTLVTMNCEKCNEVHKPIKNTKLKCPKCKDEMKYQCQACKRRHLTYRHIIYHLKFKCKGSEYLYCNDCKYKDKKKYRIRIHIEALHLGGSRLRFKCRKCNMSYIGRSNARLHEKMCGLPPHLFCSFCPRTTKYKQNMINHIKKDHIDEFKSKKEFNSLINKIIKKGNVFLDNPEKAFENDLQGFTRKTYYALGLINIYCVKCKKNINLKGRDKKKNCPKCNTQLYFECKNCNTKSDSYKSMYQHIIYVCYPRNIFNCDNCEYATTRKALLCKHLQEKHLYSNDYYINCKICSYKTKKSTEFTMHMANHLIEKNKKDAADNNRLEKIKSNTADVSNNTSENSTKKTIIITGIEKWMMSYCQNCSTITKSKKRCLKCEKCDEVLLYRCGKCATNFVTRGDLYVHARDRHFRDFEPCPKCGKQFFSYNGHTYHRLICNGETQQHDRFLQCEYCPFKTLVKASLLSHVIKKHTAILTSQILMGKTIKEINE